MDKVIRLIKTAQEIDRNTTRIYTAFSSGAIDQDEKKFWLDRADEEQSHVGYFDRLIGLHEKEKLNHLFPEPDILLEETDEIRKKTDHVLQTQAQFSTLSQRMAEALKIEATLLNSNLLMMLHALEESGVEPGVDEDYRTHLESFSLFILQLKNDNTGLELAAKLLLEMWRQSRKTVRYFFKLTDLRKLIPICSHCKKIRDDFEDWHRLEGYIATHFKTSFSHGICPDCVKEYYPNVDMSETEEGPSRHSRSGKG